MRGFLAVSAMLVVTGCRGEVPPAPALPALPGVSDGPLIAVTVDLAGASASTIEQTVLAPIEKSIQALPGVRAVHSVAHDGHAEVRVVFDLDVADGPARVAGAMAAVERELPSGAVVAPTRDLTGFTARWFVVVRGSPSVVRSPEELDALDARLAQVLAYTPGVASVKACRGAPALSVRLMPEGLMACNLTALEVRRALERDHVGADMQRDVSAVGRFVVRPDSVGTNAVRLAEVATITLTHTPAPCSVVGADLAFAVVLRRAEVDDVSTRATSELRTATDPAAEFVVIDPSDACAAMPVARAREAVDALARRAHEALTPPGADGAFVVVSFESGWFPDAPTELPGPTLHLWAGAGDVARRRATEAALNIPGLATRASARPPDPEVQLVVDRARADAAGVRADDIAQTLRLWSPEGLGPELARVSGLPLHLAIGAHTRDRAQIDDLLRTTTVRARNGGVVPLASLVTVAP